MKKRPTKPQRIDSKFEEELRLCGKERIMKGFADLKPSEVSLRELTHLVTRTQSWPSVLLELKTKPKRK